MATIPRAWVDGYADSLERLSRDMRGRLADELARVDFSRPVAEVRAQLVEVMQAHVYASRALAAQEAAEFYDGMRERMVGERVGAVAHDGYSPVAVERRVRSAVEPLAKAQRLAEPAPGEVWADAIPAAEREAEATRRAARELCRALSDYVGWGVKEAAGSTVFANGRRDPRGVRFARVPRGSKSYPAGCPFCQMLASRGFAYRSELTAGGLDPDHYHSDCQCMVVPSWERSTRVEGYDPRDYDEGYQQWLDQDHSEHEAHVAATQRNRYDAQGRLKSGDGNRVDEKGALTDDDRARIRSMRTASGNATKKANRERYFSGLGVTESEWKVMSEAEQNALLSAGKNESSRAFANGLRRDTNYILTDEDIAFVTTEAKAIGIPSGYLRFNEGSCTGVGMLSGKICIRGDVFPDEQSSDNRDRMSVRAVLAHEYYGHYLHRNTRFEPGDWRDEFRASYRAALDTPNISSDERASLMVDAYQRGAAAGITLRFTPDYRRIVYGY